ncbi:hypothetical protein CYMTET_41869, partial [Cymbomonas tetramitiformis]
MIALNRIRRHISCPPICTLAGIRWNRVNNSDVQADLYINNFLRKWLNHEKQGVPKNAGTESAEGFDLAVMFRLLKHLGDPHLAMPVLHVGGTKGKGSTAAFLAHVLRASGRRVGVYSSP